MRDLSLLVRGFHTYQIQDSEKKHVIRIKQNLINRGIFIHDEHGRNIKIFLY